MPHRSKETHHPLSPAIPSNSSIRPSSQVLLALKQGGHHRSFFSQICKPLGMAGLPSQ